MTLADFIAAFRVLFPEFDGLSDAVLTIYYNQVQMLPGVICDYGMLYVAAHLIKLDQANNIGVVGTGAGGNMDSGNGEHTEEKIGEIEVTLKTMADRSADTYFTSTPYGRRYIIYRNSCPSYRFSARVYPNARIY